MGIHGRWPTTQQYKIGVKKDGTLTAITLKGFSGLGGYPLTAGGQVIGGVVMGTGMALTEELIYDQATGIPLNPNYRDAKVLTHLDIPKIEPVFVEKADPFGPYGAKGLGEACITPSVACIANAIFNATGIRLKELPLTPDKIVIHSS